MKKIGLTMAAIMTGSFLISTYASNADSKPNKDTRREIRKERRTIRKVIGLHSTDPATETQFYYDFPDAKDVTWKKGAFAEATFLDDSIQKTAYYDAGSELVGTTMQVDFSELPEKAQQKISKKYPGFYAKEVILFDDNEINESNMDLFAVSFDDEDNYFPVLANGTKELILKVTPAGEVSLFKDIR